MKQISLNDVVLFFEAYFFLALARILLTFVPFKKMLKWLGNKTNSNDMEGSLPDHMLMLLKIQLSVARGCRYSCWRTMCFEQALAAKMMLKRRKFHSRIYFGVKKSVAEAGRMKAHAWLNCGGVTLTGSHGKEDFTVVGIFES